MNARRGGTVPVGIAFGCLVFAVTWFPGVARGQDAESPPEALRLYEGAVNAQTGSAFELAVEEWGKFLTQFPKDPLAPKAAYYRAVCHLQLRQWDPAIAGFQKVIAEHPKFELLEDAFVNLGWCQYSAAEDGKKELLPAAAKTLRDLLAQFPKGKHRDEAWYFLGESLYQQGNRKEAVEAYAALTSEHPKSRYFADGLYALGVAREELEQFAEALETYTAFLTALPQHAFATEVSMRKAECLVRTGSIEEAERLFAASAAAPDFAAADHARMRRGYCLDRLERFAEAAAIYAALVKDLPESAMRPDAEIAAARSYYRAKNVDEAMKWFETAKRRGGEAALEAAHWMCRLLLQAGKAADAEKLAADSLSGTAGGGAWLVHLRFDHADALYEQPAKRSQALVLYLKIAEDHPEHRIAPQALYNAAIAALDAKDYDLALRLGEQHRKAYPTDGLAADARRILVESLIQKRDYARAIDELTKLIADFPEHAERPAWRVRAGMVHYLQRAYPQAIDHLTPLAAELGPYPELLAESQYWIGASRFQQDAPDPAIAALEASRAASATWRQADECLLLLARCLHKQSRTDDAIALTREMIAKYPQSTALDQAWYRLGDFLYAGKQFAEAKQAYAKTIESYADSVFVPYALFGRGWAELSAGEHPAAITDFSAIVTSHASHELADDARLALGMARRQASQHDKAIEDLNAFVATNPPPARKSEALYERGLAESALKKAGEAAATFAAILADDPTFAKADAARYELAWAYRTSEQDDKAVAEFAKLAAEHPKSPLAAEAHFHVGEHHYKAKAYKEAAASYTSAIAGANSDELKEKSLYKLGWSRFQLDDPQAAHDAFAEQAKAFPNGTLAGDAGFMKGDSLFKVGKYAEALAAFQETRQKKPSSESMEMLMLLHAGQAAAQVKQWDVSLAFLDALITGFPKTPHLAEARFERGSVLRNQEKLDDALREFDAAASATTVVGARARFMMGEVRFARKEFPEAIREFQRTMFLYGGENAPAEIKAWQARAGFEAGRCAEVRIGSSATPQAKASAIADAKKFYTFVVEKHAQSELAAEAQKRLAELAKL